MGKNPTLPGSAVPPRSRLLKIFLTPTENKIIISIIIIIIIIIIVIIIIIIIIIAIVSS